MSKIVIEQFEFCHKFIFEVVKFILPILQRMLVQVEHNVSCEDFVIFIRYDKDKFQHKIDEFVKDIIKEAQKSELYRYGWKVHRPLVEERKAMPHEYIPHSIAISFTTT